MKGYFSGIYFVTLILTTGSSVFLIAPSVHHRLLFRLQEKERVVVVANGLSLIGVTLLALAMTGVVTDFPQVRLGGSKPSSAPGERGRKPAGLSCSPRFRSPSGGGATCPATRAR